MKNKKKFVIFAHSGTYDKLYQILTLAITAASMGIETHIFLFFWALKRFANEEFDPARLAVECGAEGEKLLKRMEEINPISLKELLCDVRAMGNLKVYACIGAVITDGIGRVCCENKGRRYSGTDDSFGNSGWCRSSVVYMKEDAVASEQSVIRSRRRI